MSFVSHEIYPVKQFGHMAVYARVGYRKLHVFKYIVFDDKSGVYTKEFRTKQKAFRWAKICS